MPNTRRTGLPVELARAPLRTVRAKNVEAYAHPGSQLARLVERGLLHRLSSGYFVVIPEDRRGMAWLPTLEGAAAGIGAADFGSRGCALMGVSAARMHHALPRAIGVAVVAAPRRRRTISLSDRSATVGFLVRDLDVINVELMATDLGSCLVTTPEQTLLDLAHRPSHDGVDGDVAAAMRALAPQCDGEVLSEIASTQRLGQALLRVRQAGLVP